MKRRRLLSGCGLFLVLLGLLVGGCGVFFHLFSRQTRREPELAVRPFFETQAAVLPSGWRFMGVDERDFSTDDASTWGIGMVSFAFEYEKVNPRTYRRDQISEEIHIFGNPLPARVLGPRFDPVPRGKDRYVPEGWSYRPIHADGWEFGCEGGDGRREPERCGVVLRYQEYVIALTVPMSYMMLGDLQRLLEVIDEEMGAFLRRSKVEPGRRDLPAALFEGTGQ